MIKINNPELCVVRADPAIKGEGEFIVGSGQMPITGNRVAQVSACPFDPTNCQFRQAESGFGGINVCTALWLRRKGEKSNK